MRYNRYRKNSGMGKIKRGKKGKEENWEWSNWSAVSKDQYEQSEKQQREKERVWQSKQRDSYSPHQNWKPKYQEEQRKDERYGKWKFREETEKIVEKTTEPPPGLLPPGLARFAH